MFEFNQAFGVELDKNNEWYQLANRINWQEAEKLYASMFNTKGHPAKPVRIALGALIIQKRMMLSDRELLKQIAENPYYQYFIGLESFVKKCPFTGSSLVNFRKRFTEDFIGKLNEMFLSSAPCTREHEKQHNEPASEGENNGTLIMDATCSPSNIRYPQDFSLLNEAREKTEEMIAALHKQIGDKKRPRTYKKVLRQEYLAVSMSKKRTTKKVRSLIRKQLCALKRNMAFIDSYIANGGKLSRRHIELLPVIKELYKQQKEMFDNHTHHVANRIVSLSQSYIRPIVRGKLNKPVEFGAKYHVTLNEKGHARLIAINFNAFNEGKDLPDAVEGYRDRTGHYPKKVLADKIYRTKANRSFCEERGIKLSGRPAGRPSKDKEKMEKSEEHKDDVARNEVERFFSREKGTCGGALIVTKLYETTMGSIALSIFVANLFGIPFGDFFCLLILECQKSCQIPDYMAPLWPSAVIWEE